MGYEVFFDHMWVGFWAGAIGWMIIRISMWMVEDHHD